MAPRSRKPAQPNGKPAPSSPSPLSANVATLSDKPEAEGAPSALLAPVLEDREEVKVNNASVTEMKHACDDALKRFLSRPDLFKQIYTHTDVRLALGWLSVFVAGGTGLYGWKVDFENSKPGVWAGVILYVLLTLAQTLYAYFVEGDIVFVGKRKTFDKRIVTERITVTSRTIPSTPATAPAYALSLTYVCSAAGGKTLLGKGRAAAERGYNEFFDTRGVMDQERFERWVGSVVSPVMEGKSE
ncbi:hypothetical protein A0H81_12268 [Grifola frondosa]|uniref:Signal peptidase complex subunit 2 n=1 Tax=Grifola frondosa TaxID=5627 RepID=A0A1C7LSB5_GRIFR|nr:hypothetical protein A0H81_12268 [Grifola frondosa]